MYLNVFIFLISVQRINCRAINDMELGDYFEGDIIPSPLNDAITNPMQKWPKATVPYIFSENYPYNGMVQMERAMSEFHKYTCIRFRPANDSDKNYLVLRNDKNYCASNVGMIGGEQQIHLPMGCLETLGIVLHELMHALGVYHEHSRADRDKYVTILWNNIKKDKIHNFNNTRDVTSDYGVPYNPRSLMHYNLKSFAKDKQSNTLEIKNQSIDLKLVGQRTNFSRLDLLKLNRLYNCTLPDWINLEDDDN